MKKTFIRLILSTSLVAAAAFILCAATPGNTPAPSAPANNANAKVRTVNFKKCVEQSKLGKEEQASFEAMKKQMESVLTEKEKTLNELAEKLEDADYLDSLSAEAETEMKRKFRGLSQEYGQLQQQYMQTLNQTNFKVVQKIQEKVNEAATQVARQNNFDLVVNDETAFFASPSLDITSQIVSTMDQNYEKDAGDASKKASQAPSFSN